MSWVARTIDVECMSPDPMIFILSIRSSHGPVPDSRLAGSFYRAHMAQLEAAVREIADRNLTRTLLCLISADWPICVERNLSRSFPPVERGYGTMCPVSSPIVSMRTCSHPNGNGKRSTRHLTFNNRHHSPAGMRILSPYIIISTQHDPTGAASLLP